MSCSRHGIHAQGVASSGNTVIHVEITVIPNTEPFGLAGRFQLHLNGCRYTAPQSSFALEVRSNSQFFEFYLLSLLLVYIS